MGKRSNFKRKERDFYPTPYEAILPLLPHLYGEGRFVEPCAGDGALIRHLEKHGFFCMQAMDIEPQNERVHKGTALGRQFYFADYIITNPPWTRKILHPMIDDFRVQFPTWLLFDADWQYTVQERVAKKHGVKTVPELMRYCHKIVAVGRVKWVPGSKGKGKDNCAWYLFKDTPGPARFYPRKGAAS